MSDFRVVVINGGGEFDYELDWSQIDRKWTLSERETSLGAKWVEGAAVTSFHLSSLLCFFRIDSKQVKIESLEKLSPAELALIHRNQHGITSVYAIPCEKCSIHWYIIRWEDEKSSWRVYGRNCDFIWSRGGQLTDEQIIIFGKIRGKEDKPLAPPD